MREIREIEPDGVYVLRPSMPRRQSYFGMKYGEPNPTIQIECNANKLWPMGWYHAKVIGPMVALASMLPDYRIPFLLREPAFYGKVKGMGEIVLLEEIGEKIERTTEGPDESGSESEGLPEVGETPA